MAGHVGANEAQRVGIYGRLIWRWEHRLHALANNRVVRPFEWGLDWLGVDRPEELADYAGRALAASHDFFGYQPVTDYRIEGEWLRFSSPLVCRYPENNVVHARYFPAAQSRCAGRAVLVIPQWNANEQGHVGLCRLLNRFGLSALRLSLPYHDRRMPAELQRADYAVSSNVGRTVHANRQAVIDARAALDWLAARGYHRLGVLGTSLGSCIAFIAAAHEPRVRAGAFNHVSTHFADAVWRGLSTAHVRAGLEGGVALEELRRIWAPISPAAYVALAARRSESGPLRSLIVWARYDLSFPPDLAHQFMGMCRARGLPFDELRLPCGHYTTGVTPFQWIDGVGMCRFLARNL